MRLELTLEELDHVFSVPTWKHALYQIKNSIWHFRVWILRQKLEPLPKLYQGTEHLGEGAGSTGQQTSGYIDEADYKVH